MITKLQNIKEIIRKHKLVAKYIVTGVSTTLIDITMLYILTEYYGYWYLLSATVALIASYSTAFVVQKYWTFGDYSGHDLHGQFFRYFVTVLLSAVLNLTTLSLLVEFGKIDYLFAQLLSLFAAGVFGFVMNVRNVFSRSGDNHGIVIASGIYPPEIGGPASQIAELAKRLSDKGTKIAVVTYAKRRLIEEVGSVVEITRIPSSWPAILRGPAYLTFLFTGSVKHHTIFAQDVTSTGLPAVVVKKILPHKRLVIRIGGDLLWERKVESGETKLSLGEYYNSGAHSNQRIFKIGRFVMRSADEIVVPAEYLREIYVKYYGVDESKISVIKNPVPVVEGGNTESLVLERTILFAGRFIKLKNVDSLINAFSNIYDEVKPAKLVLIGDGSELRHYEEMVEQSKAKDSIKIIHTLPRSELMAEISKASLCVCPSISEVNSNFTLECLASGKPVLLTRHNGLSVRLPEEMLIAPDNQKEIEDKIKSLLAGGYDKSALAKLVAEESEANSWDNILEQYSKVFQI